MLLMGVTSASNCAASSGYLFLPFAEKTVMSLLREILHSKGSLVHSITQRATLADAVQQLVHKNLGSLVVCESEDDPTHMIGIITERDILRACADRNAPLEQVRVSEVMSRELITCSPDDTVQDAMGAMTNHRIRHLPIIDDDGSLMGIVSIGDLVKHQHDQLTMENHYLKTYIHG
jgi:CBS domain-containing protein